MTILQQICDKKRTHVEAQKVKIPFQTLKQQITQTPQPRGFLDNLKANAPCAIIAEVKKASPSKGLLSDHFDPADIAANYQSAGAACISTLTDQPYFQGEDNDLTSVIKTTSIPILRKDFIIDEYQIYESRALGADCILLIMAALTDAQAQSFYTLARDLGMDVLVEIHDEPELERALKFNPRLIGINNRNLKTLDVTLETSFNLVDQMPDTVFKISESGITGIKDIQSLQSVGFQGFLIGEILMRQENPQKTLKNWLTQTMN